MNSSDRHMSNTWFLIKKTIKPISIWTIGMIILSIVSVCLSWDVQQNSVLQLLHAIWWHSNVPPAIPVRILSFSRMARIYVLNVKKNWHYSLSSLLFFLLSLIPSSSFCVKPPTGASFLMSLVLPSCLSISGIPLGKILKKVSIYIACI